jgi:hypothetical protein
LCSGVLLTGVLVFFTVVLVRHDTPREKGGLGTMLSDTVVERYGAVML